MINVCLKNPIVEGNLTILEMMAELDKLRQENEQLKTIAKERDEWKEGFTILHNAIENEEGVSFENGKLIVSNPSLEDLNLTNKFLNKTEDCGYDPDEMENAYLEAEKNCKFDK